MKKILVVDDEPALTRMVKLNLEQTGRYEVQTENKGRMAIEHAREFRPDLILLDVLMPGMLGSEIAAQLREDPELHSTRVAFVTAIMTKDEERSVDGRIGGQAFIAKPVGADELSRFIDEQLRQ